MCTPTTTPCPPLSAATLSPRLARMPKRYVLTLQEGVWRVHEELYQFRSVGNPFSVETTLITSLCSFFLRIVSETCWHYCTAESNMTVLITLLQITLLQSS